MEIKKQKSWFNTNDIDFENSFKFWFAIQWENRYIQLFMVGFILSIVELVKFGWVMDVVYENFYEGGNFGGIATILGLSIPTLIATVVSYSGFYKFWVDLKDFNKGKNI